MPENKETAILKVTENMIRQGGYNSFSFRNVADMVGIKSSSVHYHFATKEDLGAAVTKHYTDNFINSLGNPEEHCAAGQHPIEIYINAFKNALNQDKRICLCLMLGTEIDVLPERVVNETRAFFKRNIAWLERAYTALGLVDDANTKAVQTLTLLEGAMLTTHVMGDVTTFDTATQLILP